MAQAVLEGLVLRNPVLATTPIRRVNKEKSILTLEQIEHFLTIAKSHRLFCIFYLYVSTGMRRSEALALRWSDFSPAQKVVRICRSRTKYNERDQWFSEPKTPASRRSIPLTDAMVQALNEHRNRQLIEKEKAKGKYNNYDLIFCQEDGLPIHPDSITNMTIKFMNKANLPNCTPHSLRHSFTSLLGQLGISPKVAQELLGHTTIRMTMDVYSHVMPGMKESAIDQLGKALGEEKAVEEIPKAENVEPEAIIQTYEPEKNPEPIVPKHKLHETKVVYLSAYAKLRRIS